MTWAYPHGDPSILLFNYAVQAWALDLPTGARVLELGCCESDFHVWLKASDPSIRLTGVDVNDCPDYLGTFIRGAAEDCDFEPSSFEAVVMLGSLEHFGLGFYGDRVNETADADTMRRVGTWLVPGGWCYYDVPWTPASHYITDNRHFRVYDDRTLPTDLRLEPRKRFYAHGETNAIQPTRPESPTCPFWYCARLLEKPA
jgi:hypothetical protein